MCRCSITPGPGMTQPQADFIGCLLTGVIAALPYFLETFLRCLGGSSPGDSNDAYTPGDRQRCD